ncbi:MAG: fumarylacetoacetate hydrolase family protein [Candidatus Promineifilaceae bacterium]
MSERSAFVSRVHPLGCGPLQPGISMADFVFPPLVAFVPIEGAGDFAVRRVFCVGRNYAEHAREMGHDPDAEPPFFFMKPADALVIEGAPTPYPPADGGPAPRDRARRRHRP